MIETGQMAVSTTATQIDGNRNNPSRLIIHNLDNTDTLFVGNDNVTTANGLGVQKLESFAFDVPANDSVFVVSPKSGHLISWMRISH